MERILLLMAATGAAEAEAALRAAKAAGFQVVLVGPGHPAEASALADVTVSDYRDMIRVER